ncbi:unnamed protein product [Caenorhabditis brenneri]
MLPPIPQQVTIQQTDNVEVTRQTEDQFKLSEELGVGHQQSDRKLTIDHDSKRSFMKAANFGAASISILVSETNEEKRPWRDGIAF